ncbi:MAG: Uma2 family endonuclease [Bacteroidota bacterium]
MPITRFEQLDLNKHYTYADYLSWQFEEFVELIRGRVFKMAAPGLKHQQVSVNLLLAVGNHLEQSPCQVFTAPFDVRLPLPPDQAKNEKVDTVVQPDLCVVCNPEQLDERGCQGAPDWIIEILSKSTAKKDLHDKFQLYQHAGVKEYWVVHPTDGTAIPYRLDENWGIHLIPCYSFYQRRDHNYGYLP